MLTKALCRTKIPVVQIQAEHQGVCQDEGLSLDDETFNQLPALLEVAEEARIILLHNLHVAHGLMNGTQGVVKKIIYPKDGNPNHEIAALRMPDCILVDFPQYEGPAFFQEPTKRTWVPLFPRSISDSSSKDVTRRQFPIVLGWALTPWKAQGLTLSKSVVKLGKAISDPGVLFVALSRVQHPDNLMLDDEFPVFLIILKQARKATFKTRQNWENSSTK